MWEKWENFPLELVGNKSWCSRPQAVTNLSLLCILDVLRRRNLNTLFSNLFLVHIMLLFFPVSNSAPPPFFPLASQRLDVNIIIREKSQDKDDELAGKIKHKSRSSCISYPLIILWLIGDPIDSISRLVLLEYPPSLLCSLGVFKRRWKRTPTSLWNARWVLLFFRGVDVLSWCVEKVSQKYKTTKERNDAE